MLQRRLFARIQLLLASVKVYFICMTTNQNVSIITVKRKSSFSALTLIKLSAANAVER
nr:hypothetical protein [Buzura suppressaria nucleopolyhedrovirus]